MRYTSNYGLLKPEGTEFYNVNDFNDNMDIVDSELQTTTNIAKGRNQALVYSTYADMVAALNTMPNDELNVGQNIYIGAVGVPDVWVYGVLEDSAEYTYVSDEAIIEAVENNVSLQIGHYSIAFLETQKVDLTTIEEEIDEIKDSLTNEDNETFNFGIKDGVRGFFTDPSRADDSFIPFKHGKTLIINDFTYRVNTEMTFDVSNYNTVTFNYTSSANDHRIYVYLDEVQQTNIKGKSATFDVSNANTMRLSGYSGGSSFTKFDSVVFE